MSDLWVFGYGSLMWNPGFAAAETVRARLSGHHRALCVHSHVHRGTPQKPGLVLGLDRGGACCGLAFRVSPGEEAAVMTYLRARELVTNVYLERRVRLQLSDGRRVIAVTYVVDRSHDQYAPRMQADVAARIVAEASGQSGPNPAYVANTVMHLRELGIRDRPLEAVFARLMPCSA